MVLEPSSVWKRRREGRELQEASACAKVLRREEFREGRTLKGQ